MEFIKISNNKMRMSDITNLLRKYLFDTDVKEFNESETYNTGDIIYKIEQDDVLLLKAAHDNITGVFHKSDWLDYTLKTELTDENGLKNILLSVNQPSEECNASLWLQPIGYEYYELPEGVNPPQPDLQMSAMEFSVGVGVGQSNGIPMVGEAGDETTPSTLIEGDILIDLEGEFEDETISIEDINSLTDVVFVEDQDDIDVGDTSTNTPVWVDTDTTDDDITT